MPPLQVRDCPDGVYERLRDCAARENRSIAQQTLSILETYLQAYESGSVSRGLVRPGCPADEAGFRAVARNGVLGRGYVESRCAVFERLDALPKISLPEGVTVVDLVREARDERC